MKLFFALIFAALILAGCSKKGDVGPKNNSGKSGDNSIQPDPASHLTHDDSIHMAMFNINAQHVKTSVSGNKLTLVFNENVDLLFPAEGYQKTSAIHVLEDFKTTLLNGFDFSTVAEGGNTTLNWVDDNLNNVILKRITDTVINRVKLVKINVHRPFTFYKQYASNADALSARAVFVSKTDDTVVFTAYCYYNQKNYQSVSEAALLLYGE